MQSVFELKEITVLAMENKEPQAGCPSACRVRSHLSE